MTTISTKNFQTTLLPTILSNQAQLAKDEIEASSGRYADIGETLGYQTGQDISLHSQNNFLTTIQSSNNVASTNLTATQNTLTSISSDAQSFLSALTTAQTSGNYSTLQAQAQGFLANLTSSLNTSVGGDYIFGGINSGTKPVQDYVQTPPSAAQLATSAAFATAFPGVTQGSSQESSISPSSLTSFLSGAFGNLFNSTSWKANWSSASDTVPQSRISQTELVDSGATANNPAFAQLASAYAAISDLGVGQLSSQSAQALISSVQKTLSSGAQGVTDLQSTLGVTQSRVSSANDRITIQTTLLNNNISNLESVNPATVATQVSQLQTQLETAYTLTSQLSKLSLVNYLSSSL